MLKHKVARHEAHVNITFSGQNGDMQDPVPFDATDHQIKAWVLEAVKSGSVAGIAQHRTASLGDCVVDRFPATTQVPYNRIFVRPRTPFG
ncbi:MAG: hypothetical protein AAFS10_15635 [Myxococcota bacterium]